MHAVKFHQRIMSFMIIFLCFILFFNISVWAAEETAEVSKDSNIMYWILIGFVLVVGYSLYIIRKAVRLLHESGKKIGSDLSVWRTMAHNKTMVSIILFVLVLLGVICAIKFQG